MCIHHTDDDVDDDMFLSPKCSNFKKKTLSI